MRRVFAWGSHAFASPGIERPRGFGLGSGTGTLADVFGGTAGTEGEAPASSSSLLVDAFGVAVSVETLAGDGPSSVSVVADGFGAGSSVGGPLAGSQGVSSGSVEDGFGAGSSVGLGGDKATVEIVDEFGAGGVA